VPVNNAIAILGLSSGDDQPYPAQLDFTRALRINNSDLEYHLFQLGELKYRDDFNSTLQWAAATGTVAVDTANYLKPTQSIKLTTGAAAGDTAIARKLFSLCADQSFKKTALIGVECWYKPADAYARDFQMYCRVDDSANKWEAAVRFLYQYEGTAQDYVQYLDSSGNFDTVDTYVIPAGGGVVSDPWHRVGLYLNYLQGASGYLTYAGIKFDDFTWIPTVSPGSHAASTASVRETNVDITITADGSNAAVMNVDEFLLGDIGGIIELGVGG
jgi:hypothetical protein